VQECARCIAGLIGRPALVCCKETVAALLGQRGGALLMVRPGCSSLDFSILLSFLDSSVLLVFGGGICFFARACEEQDVGHSWRSSMLAVQVAYYGRHHQCCIHVAFPSAICWTLTRPGSYPSGPYVPRGQRCCYDAFETLGIAVRNGCKCCTPKPWRSSIFLPCPATRQYRK